MRKNLTLFVLCMICGLASLAQDEPTLNINVKKIVDSVFYGKQGFSKTKSVIGASVCIFWKDSIYYFSYGYQDKEKKKKVDTNTVYEIGGATQLFTSLLYANELTAGTIDSNALIDRFVPLNKNISGKIRVLQLATSTSGLPRFTFDDTFFLHQMMKQDSAQPLSLLDKQSMLNLLTEITTLPDFKKYTPSYYSYGLLSFILGQVTHKDYNSLLKKNILDPLNLSHTTAQLNTEDTSLAKGYDNRHLMPYLKLDALAPAAILKSNITDLGHFLRNEMEADKSVLAAPINAQIKTYVNDTAQRLSLGWSIKRLNHTPTYIQTGDTYGFTSLVAFSQTCNVGIIILLNSANHDVAAKSFSYIHREFYREFDAYNNMIIINNARKAGIPVPVLSDREKE